MGFACGWIQFICLSSLLKTISYFYRSRNVAVSLTVVGWLGDGSRRWRTVRWMFCVREFIWNSFKFSVQFKTSSQKTSSILTEKSLKYVRVGICKPAALKHQQKQKEIIFTGFKNDLSMCVRKHVEIYLKRFRRASEYLESRYSVAPTNVMGLGIVLPG